MALDLFDSLTRDWFANRFGAPTEPQWRAWPEIRAGRDVLISAPTGSGKTLAAFFIAIDGLVRAARAGSLEDRTYVVYVSPLKALSNDVRKNLETPLAELRTLAESRGEVLAEIRPAVRTGDTPAKDRAKMTGSAPPHILVTTPESLYILLTSEGGRKMLRGARTVIADEIHAVADDKRGSHLALTLERLDALAREHGGQRLQRIGLSATVKPIEAVAGFLGNDVHIVSAGHRRAMELAVESPRDELGAVATNGMWGEIYDRIATLVQENRTTLVFVNTRRLSERVAHHLAERIGADAVLPHHGSLSRELRMVAEERLKSGGLRCVVATASLELGIDIGAVDLVCQVGSPRSIAVALQRVGRAGHWVGALPKGRFFATTRDELVECAALVRAIRAGELDALEIPEAPLDVLAQQIVAIAATGDWAEDDLFTLVRRAYPYRRLERKDFDDVIEMLSEGIASSRGRRGAYLHRDRVNGIVKGRRGARLAAITSGGAIPEVANYLVVAEPDGSTVGTLDEDFAIESAAGDVFLLGTTSWRIRRVEQNKVRVEDAKGAAPTIPFWRGEAPGRTVELSEAVSQLRADIVAAKDPVALLESESSCDRRGAEQAAAYVLAGRAALGELPTQRTVVAERFFDEAGGMQLVLHAPFGSRINRAWGLALRKRFCRTFNLELQAAATDNGLVISLSEQHSFPLEVIFSFLHPNTLEHVLTQALLDSPMFAARWKWNLSRSLAVLRFRGGKKVPPPIQRMQSDDMLAAVFPDQAACAENLTGEIRIPKHPLVKETIDNCLHEAMDLHRLRALVREIVSGGVKTVAIDTVEPSPFCHEILNANPYAYLDDAPLEERRTRAVQLRRSLPASADGIGALDPAAIAAVREESWPVVRDAEELHDALLTLGLVPFEPEWQPWFASLATSRRATVMGDRFWVAAERMDVAAIAHRDFEFAPAITAVTPRSLPETREAAAAAIARGWLESTGPWRAEDLARTLGFPRDVMDAALALIEIEGQVLRGRFNAGLEAGDVEWCNRRILARIHRLTLGRLRSEIEPVTTAEFLRFLARWQHVAPGSRLHGADGLFQVIRQLQGYELPGASWELDVLSRRIANYTPDLLDTLCNAGEVMWGRLSPHPAFERSDRRQVRPTRIAPVTIFARQDADWLLSTAAPAGTESLSHPAREVLEHIRKRGASFFNEITRGTGRLASEVEDGLWELVAGGLVTADGFENFRSLIDPKRRRGEGRGRDARPRHAPGRWALLAPTAGAEVSAEQFARQLLTRWGVVFRDLAARESLMPPWRDLLVALRRMEAKGKIRGGRFVASFIGEQFARPEAVDLLRAMRRSGDESDVEVAAADPLNLRGLVAPPREAADALVS